MHDINPEKSLILVEGFQKPAPDKIHPNVDDSDSSCSSLSPFPPYLYEPVPKLWHRVANKLLCTAKKPKVIVKGMELIHSDLELSGIFLGPLIPVAVSSSLRVFEYDGWDEMEPDGMAPRPIDVMMLNMTWSPTTCPYSGIWSHATDILDAYPSPTIENPLSLLMHAQGAYESFNTPWMLCKFAHPETVWFMESKYEHIISYYGTYNQLQEEQRWLSNCAGYAVSHLSEAIGCCDITGMCQIVQGLLNVCTSLKFLC